MTVRKDSLLLGGQVVLAALAVTLTVLSVVALASRGGNKELDELIERYDPTTKPAKDDGEQSKAAPATKPATSRAGGSTKPGSKKPAKKPKDTKKAPPKKVKSPQDEQVERICKRHMFSPAPPKKGFSATLTGVLGDEAYFDGKDKGYKAGQSYKGAKIKEIGPDWVELEFESKPKKLYVFGPGSGPSPSGPSAPARGKAPGLKRATLRGRMGRPPRGPRKLTPEMIEAFKAMPPEMKKKALERVSAEMREKIEKAL